MCSLRLCEKFNLLLACVLNYLHLMLAMIPIQRLYMLSFGAAASTTTMLERYRWDGV
jgi:hypothetical protein